MPKWPTTPIILAHTRRSRPKHINDPIRDIFAAFSTHKYFRLSFVVFLTESYQWDYKLLRSVALFGYNSSGKSNLIKAIGVMKFCVLYSSALPGNVFDNIRPFLLKEENASLPSHFEIIFFRGKRKYRYGFDVTEKKISSEWLFYSEPKIRENYLFVRQENEIIFSKKWDKETDGMVEKMVKKAKVNFNSLFLSYLGLLDIEPATDILKWFEKINVIEGFDSDKFANYTAELLSNEKYRYNISSLLSNALLGFNAVRERKINDGEKKDSQLSQDFLAFMIDNEIIPKGNYDILTQHNVINSEGEKTRLIEFNLKYQESIGTRKYFGLIGLLLDAIINQKILLFDELDSQLHSILYETILNFFNTPTINAKGAQLIFTSHNTHLMKGKKLRRDQMYIMTKDDNGKSTLGRLHGDDRNIRTDNNSIEKDYLNNSFESFPKINFNLFTGTLDFPEE